MWIDGRAKFLKQEMVYEIIFPSKKSGSWGTYAFPQRKFSLNENQQVVFQK